MRPLIALGWGLLFGAGLGLAGLSRPQVIQGFLDVGPRWDPSLGIALTAAVAVYAPVARWMLRRGQPFHAPRFALPEQRAIDTRLVVGAAVFGAGWGAAGMCPGANLVALGSFAPHAWLFAAVWVASAWVTRRTLATRERAITSATRARRDAVGAAHAEGL